MSCSMTGFTVFQYLPEFAQTYVHLVSDVIQPFHSRLSPLLLSCLSQHQGLFQWVKLFPSGGQSTGASVSASVLPMNIQGRFPLGLIGLIFWLSKGLSRVSSSTTVRKHQFGAQPSVGYNSHMTPGKTIALTIWTFVGKVLSLLFNMLSRFVVAFLPRSKHLLISWLQSLSTVIFEPKKIVCYCFHFFPIYLPWSDGTCRKRTN